MESREEFRRLEVTEQLFHQLWIEGVTVQDAENFPRWQWVCSTHKTKPNLMCCAHTTKNINKTLSIPVLGGELMFYSDTVVGYDPATTKIRRYIRADKMFNKINKKLSLVEIDKRKDLQRADAPVVHAVTTFLSPKGFKVTWDPNVKAPGRYGRYNLPIPAWASVVLVAYKNSTQEPYNRGISVFYNEINEVAKLAAILREEIAKYLPGHGIL